MSKDDGSRALRCSDPISGPQVLDAPQFIVTKEAYDELSLSLGSLKGQVAKKPTTAAVILAGGSGERFGQVEGKQLLKIQDKPILTWSAESFDAVPDVGLIVIVVPEARGAEYCREAIDGYPFVTPITIVNSGSIRQESSFSGVNAVPPEFEFIAIHDGARPLVTPELITHTIAAVKGSVDADGAVVGFPAIDTLKVVNENNIIGTPDRSSFWTAQTPQVFRADILREAHTIAMSEGFVGTDDSSLVERIGGTVVLVRGPRNNIKITVPEDRHAIEAGLSKRLHGNL